MLALVIDIQSDVVSGSLVNFRDKTLGHETLYSTTARIPHKTHVSATYLEKIMLKAVEDLCLHIVKALPGTTKEPIQSIEYILSTPWVISQSKTVKIKYEVDTEITERIIKDIIDEDRKVFLTGNPADMVFVEQKIFSVELNGYAVENYKGKRAKTLTVSFAFTLSSTKLLKDIENALHKHLHIKKHTYHSAILLQYLSSRALSLEEDEYVVLHVHGELTDIVMVKKGSNSLLASFPFGTSTLVRKVSASMKSSFEETSSILSMHGDTQLEKSQAKEVEATLSPIIKGWQAEFRKMLESIGKGIILPRAVHLYMDSPLLPIFKKSLEAEFTVLVHEGSLREKHITALAGVI